MAELVRIDPPRQSRPPARRGYLVRGAIAPEFVERDALAPEGAIAFKPRNSREARAFGRMRARGVVRAAAGKWWLDIVAYQADTEARSRAAVPWLILGSVVFAALATLFYQG